MTKSALQDQLKKFIMLNAKSLSLSPSKDDKKHVSGKIDKIQSTSSKLINNITRNQSPDIQQNKRYLSKRHI